MRRDIATDRRWMRRYKAIAVLGMVAVVAVPMEWVCMSFLDGFYWLFAILLCVVTLGIGYLIEHLAIKIFRHDESGEIDFSYESKIRIPWKATIPAGVITIILMIALSYAVVVLLNNVWVSRYDMPMDRGSRMFYQLFLSTTMVLGGCIGVYLRPCAFYQIVGIRTMLECVALLTFVGTMETVYGRFETVTLFFLLCLLVYMLCTGLIMNQMYVIQPSYFSPTCHATDALRRAGIRSVKGMLLTMLGYTWLCIAALSLLIFPLRVLTYSEQYVAFDWLFVFPFAYHPTLGCIVFVFSLLTLFGLITYVCLRAKNAEVAPYLTRIRQALRRLWQCICQGLRLLFLTAPSYWRSTKQQKKKERAQEPDIRLTYEDIVIHRPRARRHKETVISYGTFYRRLLAQPDAKAQYCYAYRTLVACLIRKHIGIDVHTTPQDIAKIVKLRTNIRDIDRITDLFYASAYAPEAPAPIVTELVALCDIVHLELEHERQQR